MIDISHIIPRIEVFMGYDLEEVVAQANSELRFSNAVQVTNTEMTEVTTIDGQSAIVLIVSTLYAHDGE